MANAKLPTPKTVKGLGIPHSFRIDADKFAENCRRQVEEAVAVLTAEDAGEAEQPTAEEDDAVVQPATEDADEAMQLAAEDVDEAMQPVAGDVDEAVQPAAEDADEAVQPAAEDVEEAVQPAAEDVEEAMQPAAEDEAVQPAAKQRRVDNITPDRGCRWRSEWDQARRGLHQQQQKQPEPTLGASAETSPQAHTRPKSAITCQVCTGLATAGQLYCEDCHTVFEDAMEGTASTELTEPPGFGNYCQSFATKVVNAGSNLMQFVGLSPKAAAKTASPTTPMTTIMTFVAPDTRVTHAVSTPAAAAAAPTTPAFAPTTIVDHLGQHWASAVDIKGRVYWWNKITKVTQWEKPTLSTKATFIAFSQSQNSGKITNHLCGTSLPKLPTETPTEYNVRLVQKMVDANMARIRSAYVDREATAKTVYTSKQCTLFFNGKAGMSRCFESGLFETGPLVQYPHVDLKDVINGSGVWGKPDLNAYSQAGRLYLHFDPEHPTIKRVLQASSATVRCADSNCNCVSEPMDFKWGSSPGVIQGVDDVGAYTSRWYRGSACNTSFPSWNSNTLLNMPSYVADVILKGKFDVETIDMDSKRTLTAAVCKLAEASAPKALTGAAMAAMIDEASNANASKKCRAYAYHAKCYKLGLQKVAGDVVWDALEPAEQAKIAMPRAELLVLKEDLLQPLRDKVFPKTSTGTFETDPNLIKAALARFVDHERIPHCRLLTSITRGKKISMDITFEAATIWGLKYLCTIKNEFDEMISAVELVDMKTDALEPVLTYLFSTGFHPIWGSLDNVPGIKEGDLPTAMFKKLQTWMPTLRHLVQDYFHCIANFTKPIPYQGSDWYHQHFTMNLGGCIRYPNEAKKQELEMRFHLRKVKIKSTYRGETFDCDHDRIDDEKCAALWESGHMKFMFGRGFRQVIPYHYFPKSLAQQKFEMWQVDIEQLCYEANGDLKKINGVFPLGNMIRRDFRARCALFKDRFPRCFKPDDPEVDFNIELPVPDGLDVMARIKSMEGTSSNESSHAKYGASASTTNGTM
jgi:gas vesicle protein